jgi:hypothetical protein
MTLYNLTRLYRQASPSKIEKEARAKADSDALAQRRRLVDKCRAGHGCMRRLTSLHIFQVPDIKRFT